MSGIMRLGNVEVQVNDLDKASQFYREVLGLQEVKRTKEKLYLKCWDEYDHHSVVLKQASGLGLVKISWKVEREQDLVDLEKKIEAYGIKVKRLSKNEELAIGEAVSFTAPSGQTMMLYHQIEQVGRGVSMPEIYPQGIPGIAPPHLDHLVIAAEDVDETVKFLTSVLGFRISERVVDPEGHSIFSFLFIHGKPHDIAISKGPSGKFHHFAFYLDDWNDVGRAARILAGNKMQLDVPPSKHGITRGTTTYFRDPAGNRLETFAGGYLTYPDFPTITWPVEHIQRALFSFGGPSNLEQFMEWI